MSEIGSTEFSPQVYNQFKIRSQETTQVSKVKFTVQQPPQKSADEYDLQVKKEKFKPKNGIDLLFNKFNLYAAGMIAGLVYASDKILKLWSNYAKNPANTEKFISKIFNRTSNTTNKAGSSIVETMVKYAGKASGKLAQYNLGIKFNTYAAKYGEKLVKWPGSVHPFIKAAGLGALLGVVIGNSYVTGIKDGVKFDVRNKS